MSEHWLDRFWSELKRRKVVRVAVVYAVAAWAAVEVASVVFPTLLLPDWTLRLLVILALLGFPIALGLAWAFEVRPEKASPRVIRDVSGPPAEERCWRDWPGHNKEDVALSFELHRPDFSAVPPPRALRAEYRPVRYAGHEFWVRRGTAYAIWDRL